MPARRISARRSVKPETVWLHYCRQRLTLAFGSDACLFKVHGGLGQEPGIADLVGVVNGKGVALELKTPGGKGKLSPLQKDFLQRWTVAGGFSMVVDSEESLKAAIEYLRMIKNESEKH